MLTDALRGLLALVHDGFSRILNRLTDWDLGYRRLDPRRWYYHSELLDEDFTEALARLGPPPGSRLLDAGTGLGIAARELSRKGYRVAAADLSPRALELARAAAFDQAGTIAFVRADLSAPSPAVQGPFDAVHDRGCFHSLSPDRRKGYASTMASLLRSGGLLYLKTLSRAELLAPGPFRFSPEEIEALFAPDFSLVESRKSRLGRGWMRPWYLLCVLRRR